MQITRIYHHRLADLPNGTEIITRQSGKADRHGCLRKLARGPAIETEHDPYPVLIGPTVHVYQVERS